MSTDGRSFVRRAELPVRSPYVAPRSPTEARIAQIWATALRMDRVGVEDRYHDLGGDSLLALVIFNMMSDAFRLELKLSLLAQTPTIAQLAARIDAMSPADPKTDA